MMAVMFDRFSDEARRTVVRALVEARRLGHDYVGTEHALVALVLADGAAANALASEGVTVDRARLAVADVVGRGRGVSPWDDGPYTARVRHAFELCKREAYEFGHRYIASGHLLLAVVQIGDANAVRVLAHLGVDLDTLRQKPEDSLATERPPVAPTERRTHLGRPPAIAGLSGDLDDLDEVAASDELAPDDFDASDELDKSDARRCSFCTLPVDARDRYVAGAEALICAGCVQAAARLIGDDTPGPAVDGHAPDEAAVTEVARAFTTVFDPSGSDAERAALLEDGAALVPLLAWVHERYPGDGGARVERIRFLDGNRALVHYAAGWGPPHPSRSGWARRHATGWKVTRETCAAVLHDAGIPPI
jgi:hypothetical protein